MTSTSGPLYPLLPLGIIIRQFQTTQMTELFRIPEATRVGDEDVIVAGIRRISHPAYRVSNSWYSLRDPWNLDYTRVLIYETQSTTDPVSGEKGRGMVWGFVEDLMSWHSSDRWFLCSSGQGAYDKSQPWYAERPLVVDYFIWQVYFDGARFTYRDLLRVKTAGRWAPGGEAGRANAVGNFHAHLIPILRKDGRQIYYTATQGLFSYADHQRAGVTPWGLEGAFLADLTPTAR